MTPSELLSRPFTLPNGSVIPNRFAKSAMSETLGSIDNHPTKELITLYRAWADGGAGLSITGNVMIDRRHIGEPQNVVVEDEADLDLLKSWARAGQGGGKQIWMQLNHPGKQSPKMLNRDPVSPSAIPFKKDLRGMFATPRALTGPEIDDIIRRFAQAAAVAKRRDLMVYRFTEPMGIWLASFCLPITINAPTSGVVLRRTGGALYCLCIEKSARLVAGDLMLVSN